MLVCLALAEIAPHSFTTRDLEFRGDHVDRDYGRLARGWNTSVDHIVRVRQVHGRAIVVVARGQGAPAPVTEADAIVVADASLVASVRVADCVPVLIADRQHRLVAAVHAGWRGTTAGVTNATVAATATLGVRATDLVAAIGPSIGACCYQVNRVVREEFHATWGVAADPWFRPDGPDHWRLDLWAANRDQLLRAGVLDESIFVAGLCTADHPDDWYSHRREGAETGRMVASIGLRSEA